MVSFDAHSRLQSDTRSKEQSIEKQFLQIHIYLPTCSARMAAMVSFDGHSRLQSDTRSKEQSIVIPPHVPFKTLRIVPTRYVPLKLSFFRFG